MTSYMLRGIAVSVALVTAGCGTYAERDNIRSVNTTGNQNVQDSLARMRLEDLARGAAVREINSVWLGSKTIKVAREAELPPVFKESIRFEFPDRPTLPVIADRLSKIVGLSVRVSPDALIPLEVFAAQRMSASGGLGGAGAGAGSVAGANGVTLPSNVTMPMSGPIGQTVPSLSMLSGAGSFTGMAASPQMYSAPRAFILDQANPYGGTLTDLLDQISAKFGVGWDYKDGVILVSRLVTRTYQIATITDANDVTSTIAKTASTGVSGGNASSGGGGNITQAGNVSSSADVAAKMSASVDVVRTLKTAIESALTPGGIGKLSISASGVVTVTDTREVQEQVEELINAENRSVSRQVRMRMQIVDLTATTNNDTGVNWAWLINDATRKWNVNIFSPTGLPAGSTGFGQIGVIRNGDSSKTSTFLQALATVGKVNVRKDETYPMMNNRPLSIADTQNFIYPARSSAASSNNDSATVVPGVEPGQLTTGTFLNMRSAIQPNGSIIVQFSMDASMRGETRTFENNGVTLQYPQSSANQYQIYTSIQNGETAVLAGVTNTQQQSNDRSLDSALSPMLGGGASTSATRRAVLILLTPQIIEGVN